MKMFKVLMLAGFVSLPFAVSASAADMDAGVDAGVPAAADPGMIGLYLRADLGWSFLQWDGGLDDNALVGSAGVGYKVNDNIRGDITFEKSGDYDVAAGSTLATTAVMGNVYFDWANDTMFTPYVGVGAGYGWVDGTGAVADDSGIALGLAAGVSVDLTANLAVDVGYRFRDVMIAGPDTQEHQVLAGFRFGF
jgi:opacity protein-like surface antigen